MSPEDLFLHPSDVYPSLDTKGVHIQVSWTLVTFEPFSEKRSCNGEPTTSRYQ